MEKAYFYTGECWNSKLNREDNPFIRTIINASLRTTKEHSNNRLTGNLPEDGEIIKSYIIDSLEACNFMALSNRQKDADVIQDCLFSFTLADGVRDVIRDMVDKNINNPKFTDAIENKLQELNCSSDIGFMPRKDLEVKIKQKEQREARKQNNDCRSL